MAVIACFVNRRWVREFVMWLLGGLFLAVLAYALFTDDAVLGIAVSGIALILWLGIKSESTEPGSREE